MMIFENSFETFVITVLERPITTHHVNIFCYPPHGLQKHSVLSGILPKTH